VLESDQHRISTEDTVSERILKTLEDAAPLREYLETTGDPRYAPDEELHDRSPEWSRIARCIRGAFPTRRHCVKCARVHVTLEGSCKSRICPICKERYGRQRAQVYRDRLGPAEYLHSLIVTMPPEVCEGWHPGIATNILNLASKAYLRTRAPYIPAGLVTIHWAGDEDPMEGHPHLNFVVSSREYLPETGEVVRRTRRMVSEETLRDTIVAVSAGLGVPPDRAQGHRRWHADHTRQRHLLRYMLRAQGCGDPVARAHWSLPRARTTRALGMLGGGKLRIWRRKNAWSSAGQRHRALGLVETPTGELIEAGPPCLCPGCGRATEVLH